MSQCRCDSLRLVFESLRLKESVRWSETLSHTHTHFIHSTQTSGRRKLTFTAAESDETVDICVSGCNHEHTHTHTLNDSSLLVTWFPCKVWLCFCSGVSVRLYGNSVFMLRHLSLVSVLTRSDGLYSLTYIQTRIYSHIYIVSHIQSYIYSLTYIVSHIYI